MNLNRLLQQRAAAGKPVRVGLIGAGKFGSMFLNQVPAMDGLEVSVIADLDPSGRGPLAARLAGTPDASRTRCSWPRVPSCAPTPRSKSSSKRPARRRGIAHARAAIAAGRHIVMVNVEADVLAGPLLAEEARARGVVYSLAYGDQPALTCELVDWARACGFVERDGRRVFRDLRWGVYVTLKAPSEYGRTCFEEYGLKTDASGCYAAMYKPFHLIGLALGVPILSAALRGEPTGQPQGWRGDVVAVAKRSLGAGETLDGEGGYTVWGKLVPAGPSLAEGALPIGLARNVPLRRDIGAGETVRWADAAVPDSSAIEVAARPSAIAAK